MVEKIQYELHEEGYGLIRLNRPEKRNAIGIKMIEEFKKALQQALDDQIKFLVITGSGERMFCAGGDLNDFHGDLTPDEAFTYLYQMKEVLFELVSFPVPTICLLNGDALGGGCEIATACDFRIAKESGEFGFIQSKLGIIPGWGGGTLLYEKVHSSFAFQWLIEAEVYNASTLKEQGWIHKIVSEDELKNHKVLLKPYIDKSIEQMKILKGQYHKSLSVLSLSAQMNDEVRQCASLWNSKEHKEIVANFLSRKL